MMLARFAIDKRRRAFFSAASLSLALSLIFVLLTAACGGGHGSTGPSNPGTASGTYTLSVSGSVALGSSSLTRNLSLTLYVN